MASFPFYGPCPSCGGKDTYFWTHTSCGGSLSIDENCMIKCNYCNLSDFVMNWKFECSKHSGDPQRVNGFQIIDTISQLCRMNPDIPEKKKKKMINIINNY